MSSLPALLPILVSVIDTASPATWISNLGFCAELEQSFITVEHELLVSSVQLGFERALACQDVVVIDRLFPFIILVPCYAVVDEVVDDVGTER